MQETSEYIYKGRTYTSIDFSGLYACDNCAFDKLDRYDNSVSPCTLSEEVKNCYISDIIWIEKI